MNLAAIQAWRSVTGPAPVRVLHVPALGVRQWVTAMGHTSGIVRGLSLQEELLPEPDLAVLIDPLHATGLNVVPPAVERSMPETRIQPLANPRMQSATPVAGPREQGIRPVSGRPASGSFGAQPEVARNALEDARRAGGQPARLATILQRHVGSVARSGADTSAMAHVAAERGTASIGQMIEAAAPQRPAAGRKVVYLPARASSSVVMPDVLRAAAEPARWEANMAATLNRWAQAGAAGHGLRGAEFSSQGAVAGTTGRRLPGGIAAMPSPRLSGSARLSGSDRHAERAADMPVNKPNISGNKSIEPAGGPLPAPLVASAARLAQALRTAMPPMAGSTENPHAAAQPVIDSLARIVEQLTNIEMKFTQAVRVPAAAVGSSSEAEPAVQWLEDDDLAGRLQGILRRQAKRRGIDLS